MRRATGFAMRLCGWLTVLVIAASALAPAGGGQQADLLELQVKAAFLYNFAKFVEWPDPGLNEGNTVTFCVLGAESLYLVLGQSLSGKTINGRALAAHKTESSQSAQRCNLLFIGDAKRKQLPEVLDSVPSRGALTVGDFEQFAERGGMIQLIKDGNKFRFAINVEAVNRKGLRISSKLLQLAEPVHPAAGSKP